MVKTCGRIKKQITNKFFKFFSFFLQGYFFLKTIEHKKADKANLIKLIDPAGGGVGRQGREGGGGGNAIRDLSNTNFNKYTDIYFYL